MHAKKRKTVSSCIVYWGGRTFKQMTLKSETFTGTFFPLFSTGNVMTRYSRQMHKLKEKKRNII